MTDGVEEAQEEQQRALGEMLELLNGDEKVGHTEWALAPYRARLADILQSMVREADYARVRRFLAFMEKEEQR